MTCISSQRGHRYRVMCRLKDIPCNGSKGVGARAGTEYAELILVRTNDEVFAYRNRCPHTGAPMEWQPNVFLDCTSRQIQCGLHGALFRIHDGYCIFGPCAGRSLEPVAVCITGESVIVMDDGP